MTPDLRTIPQVLDRIADQFSDHDALVTGDRRLTFAQLRDEVRTAAGHPLTVPDTPCLNPAFDVTPAVLVTALVTERGVVSPVSEPALRAACA